MLYTVRVTEDVHVVVPAWVGGVGAWRAEAGAMLRQHRDAGRGLSPCCLEKPRAEGPPCVASLGVPCPGASWSKLRLRAWVLRPCRTQEEVAAAPSLKLLEAAYRWKRQKTEGEDGGGAGGGSD